MRPSSRWHLQSRRPLICAPSCELDQAILLSDAFAILGEDVLAVLNLPETAMVTAAYVRSAARLILSQGLEDRRPTLVPLLSRDAQVGPNLVPGERRKTRALNPPP